MTSPCGLRPLPALWRRSLLLPRSRSQRGSLLFRPLSTWGRRTVRLTTSHPGLAAVARPAFTETRGWGGGGCTSRKSPSGINVGGVGVGWGGRHFTTALAKGMFCCCARWNLHI